MTPSQSKIKYFINQNKRVSYFDYLKRENGIDPQKREEKLNNLVLYLMKGYSYIYLARFIVPIEYKEIFVFVDNLIREDIPTEDKVKEMKQKLFIQDKMSFQKTLKAIEFIQNFSEEVLKDSYLPIMIDFVIKNEKDLEELKSMMGYLESTEILGEARKRKIS